MLSFWKRLITIIIVIIVAITFVACVNKDNATTPQTQDDNNGNNNSDNSGDSHQVKSFTVTLDRQNGTGGSSSVSVEYGKPMPSASIPTRSYYTFGGYYSSVNSSGIQYYASNMASMRSWDKQAGGTLYAYWISDYKTVTLNTSNFSQYFTVTSQWVLTSHVVNGTVQAKAKWTVTLKPGITPRIDSSVFVLFVESGAIGSLRLQYIFSFGSCESSAVSVRYSSSSSWKPTIMPSNVSGILYIAK
jgi:hypothetical protein